MRIATKVAAGAAIAVVTLASQAGAQTPPGLPNLPKGEVERFQMTIKGLQSNDFKFSWTPAGNACGWHAEGSLSEHWEYARGKAVAMEFTRLSPRAIFMHRVGRPPGDAAFAAPGHLTREATGFLDMGSAPGCGGIHSFESPDCGKRFSVQSNLRLLWGNGKLTLERGSKAPENPATDCGTPGGILNFEGISSPYPLFHKQKTKLPARRIFGSSRGFKLDLKANFLAPLRDGSEWPGSTETLRGNTQLTFKRIRN